MARVNVTAINAFQTNDELTIKECGKIKSDEVVQLFEFVY